MEVMMVFTSLTFKTYSATYMIYIQKKTKTQLPSEFAAYILQLNLFIPDIKGTGISVCIIEVSVLEK